MATAEAWTFGACFTSTEFPAIIAGTANLNTCQNGKFQGITPSITPKGSKETKLLSASELIFCSARKLIPLSA